VARKRDEPEDEPQARLEDEEGPPTEEEVHDEDFQFALKELLAAYEPVLAEELERARDPERLKREALERPPTCDEELALANRIFDKFVTEDVALRLLPPEGRQQLGPVEEWRWCLGHIRCCIIFGWLVCRGPRTFRSFNYYLWRYWLCVRRVLGDAPIDRPPTQEERDDFASIVETLAVAYKPYLTDQLATVDFPLGLPHELFGGRIDCEEGEEESAAIFERLLTADIGPALLGRAAFEEHSRHPSFWFCRCWCLCAIRFGCCLAQARSFIDILRCLVFYRRCLRRCFRPLRCQLTAPTGCAEEHPLPQGGVGLEVVGTAAGSFFSHYTLQWRKVQGQACDDDTGWNDPNDGTVVHPGGGTQGTAPVVGGTLGWIKTAALAPDAFEIRVCVYSVQPNAPRTCCCIQFSLFKVAVWIDHVAAQPISPNDPFDPNAIISDGAGTVVPVGCCVTVGGSAFVGDCNQRKIKCFDLRWGIGFLPGPTQIGFDPSAYPGSLLPAGPVCYTDADPAIELQKRAPWNRVFGVGANLVTQLVDDIDIPSLGLEDLWKLAPTCFQSSTGLASGVLDATGCPDPHHRCRSGKYTLLLDVTDTLNNHYYDTQHVWFDNKPMVSDKHVVFAGVQGLPGCTDLHLGPNTPGIPPGAPCGLPWPAVLEGIAYDEYIDETDTAYPSDNFDFYALWITRQGGPTYSVPITPTLGPPPVLGPNPLHGTQRVGDPGERCEPLPDPPPAGCPAPPPIPPKVFGTLTVLDLRVFDEVCAPSLVAPFALPVTPPNAPKFPLKRGTCCGYTFQVYARDKTRSSSPVPCHEAWSLPWAVCICNDLPTDEVPDR
jgi:hypothetical protein